MTTGIWGCAEGAERSSIGHGEISSYEIPISSARANGCSGQELQTVKEDERFAMYMTSADVWAPYLQPAQGGAPHWIVQRFIDSDGIWDQATVDRLSDDLADMNRAMRNNRFEAKCGYTVACNRNEATAVAPELFDKIHFCDVYFSMDDERRASVFVHEVSHKVLGTDDNFYDCRATSICTGGSCRDGLPWSQSDRQVLYPGVAGVNSLGPGVCGFVPLTFDADSVTCGTQECASSILDTAETFEALAYVVFGEHLDDLYLAELGIAVGDPALGITYAIERLLVQWGHRPIDQTKEAAKRFDGELCHGRSARRGTPAYFDPYWAVKMLLVDADGGTELLDEIWDAAGTANMYAWDGLASCSDYENFFAAGYSLPDEAAEFFAGVETAITTAIL